MVWNKGTRLHVQELFWTLEAANAAARLHAATMPNVHTATLMQNCATLPVQISVLLRPGDVNKDVFICVDEMPEDTVKAVPLQLIKDLMRKRRLSVSGSKVELVRRMRLALTGRFSM